MVELKVDTAIINFVNNSTKTLYIWTQLEECFKVCINLFIYNLLINFYLVILFIFFNPNFWFSFDLSLKFEF
jgi:hypothetical protein